MNKKKTHNRKRSLGANIGTKENGAIKEFIEIDGKLFVVKEYSLYEVTLADNIDPNSENLKLPDNTQRLVMRLGSESEILARTLLTANKLLNKNYQKPITNINKILKFILDITQELDEIKKTVDNYNNHENEEKINFEKRKVKNTDHVTPSIPSLNTICSTVFQRANRILQIQMDIFRIFNPEFNKKSYYTDASQYIELEKDNRFANFLKGLVPFTELVRNIRNCIEHRRSEISILDYELLLNSDILEPTIEINYKDCKMKRTPLSTVLNDTLENLVFMIENMLVFLCENNINDELGVPITLSIIPEKQRKNKFMKFGYKFPSNKNGFYIQ